NLGQRLDSRRHAVELTATVIGDDDPRGAVCDSQPGIRGGKDALDENGQGADAAQPGERFPGERGVEERGDVGGERGGARLTVIDSAVLFGEIGHHQMGWQTKAVAYIPLATTQSRHIHREDEGTVAGGFRPTHQRLRDSTVLVDVQLEPEWPHSDLGDLFEAPGSKRADHHQRLRFSGRPSGGALALLTSETMVGRWCDENRHADWDA